MKTLIYDGTEDSFNEIARLSDVPLAQCFREPNGTIIIGHYVYSAGNEIEFPSLVAKPKHPLLNDESKHYEMIGGVEAIEEMEKMFTREELMAWAKLTAMKYRLRIGKKDAPEKEIKKIKTYEAYYKYLESSS